MQSQRRTIAIRVLPAVRHDRDRHPLRYRKKAEPQIKVLRIEMV